MLDRSSERPDFKIRVAQSTCQNRRADPGPFHARPTSGYPIGHKVLV